MSADPAALASQARDHLTRAQALLHGIHVRLMNVGASHDDVTRAQGAAEAVDEAAALLDQMAKAGAG